MMLVHVAPVHEVLRPLSVIQMGVEEGPADVERHAEIAEVAEVAQEGPEGRVHAGPAVEGAEAVVLKLAPEEGAAVVVLKLAPLSAITAVRLTTSSRIAQMPPSVLAAVSLATG